MLTGRGRTAGARLFGGFGRRLASETVSMAEGWSPPLDLRESAGRCRLSLVGLTQGEGSTLQEAADDLVARLLNLVLCVRTSGLRFSSEFGPHDQRLTQYLWELGECAAGGEDIRERVFGSPADAGTVL
jgi:hypothetical protein